MQASQAPIPANLRLKGAFVVESVLRLLRLIADVGEGDIEAYAIYLAVTAAGTSRMLRDPEIRNAPEVQAVHDDMRTPSAAARSPSRSAFRARRSGARSSP